MRCPDCIKEGKTSIVYGEGGITTAMYCPVYWDENGNKHVHDMNSTSWSYSCSNGHRWAEAGRKPLCPTCGDKW